MGPKSDALIRDAAKRAKRTKAPIAITLPRVPRIADWETYLAPPDSVGRIMLGRSEREFIIVPHEVDAWKECKFWRSRPHNGDGRSRYPI